MFYNTNILSLSQLNIFNDPQDSVVSVYFTFEPLFFLFAPFVCSWVKLLITVCLLSSSIVLKMYSSKIKMFKKTDGKEIVILALNQGLMYAIYFRYKRNDDRVKPNNKNHVIFGFLKPRSHLSACL